ncbi:MAG: class I SAM-dependent methyltransferase [Elusimicrobia bacterium]|nr:class I SAM-dependent methyltransferase [Elusimicrobiota bacterium]
MTTNFGAAAKDYAKFRVGFPDSLFERLGAFGIGVAGQTVVDLGTGTGTLARGFALRGARVFGIDPDVRLLEQARQLDFIAKAGVEYKTGSAEAIPFGNQMADVVSAGQCWHWFDGPAAAKEISRIARTQGGAVIAHFDWLPFPGNVVEATERLITAHNPSWHMGGGNGFHPESLPHLRSAGFSEFQSFSYDVYIAYSPEAWRGRIRASAGVGASLSRDKVKDFDAALARTLEASFPGDVLRIPHRVFAILGRKGD